MAACWPKLIQRCGRSLTQGCGRSLAVSKCPGDAKFVGMFASGDFASAGIFQDKSVNN